MQSQSTIRVSRRISMYVFGCYSLLIALSISCQRLALSCRAPNFLWQHTYTAAFTTLFIFTTSTAVDPLWFQDYSYISIQQELLPLPRVVDSMLNKTLLILLSMDMIVNHLFLPSGSRDEHIRTATPLVLFLLHCISFTLPWQSTRVESASAVGCSLLFSTTTAHLKSTLKTYWPSVFAL